MEDSFSRERKHTEKAYENHGRRQAQGSETGREPRGPIHTLSKMLSKINILLFFRWLKGKLPWEYTNSPVRWNSNIGIRNTVVLVLDVDAAGKNKAKPSEIIRQSPVKTLAVSYWIFRVQEDRLRGSGNRDAEPQRYMCLSRSRLAGEVYGHIMKNLRLYRRFFINIINGNFF